MTYLSKNTVGRNKFSELSFFIGISATISWAWGTSLILGMQIAQQKGLEAFLIWAFANCATLGIFGWMVNKGYLTEKVVKNKLVQAIMLIIQAFCFVLQLKIAYDYLLPWIGNCSTLVTTGIGVGLTLLMYKKGLKTSIRTDIWQWFITMSILMAMFFLCGHNQKDILQLPHSDSSAILWSLWSACILLSGIMTDIQHWQRVKVDKGGKAYYWATAMFACYLSLVYGLAILPFTETATALLTIAVLGVTTSTIDSVAVAMHRAGGKTIGTGICLGLCGLWTVFVETGLIDLWSYFGIIRVALGAFIVGAGLYYYFKNEQNDIKGTPPTVPNSL